MRKLLIAALVATSFSPVAFVAPAAADEAYNPADFCSSNNRNVTFSLTNLVEEEGGVELVGLSRSGNSGNVFAVLQAYSGAVTADCSATNTKSGNSVPGQSTTGVVIDEGGPIGDPYQGDKVCQQDNSSPTGTTLTAAGAALGLTQADCNAAVGA